MVKNESYGKSPFPTPNHPHESTSELNALKISFAENTHSFNLQSAIIFSTKIILTKKHITNVHEKKQIVDILNNARRSLVKCCASTDNRSSVT